MKKCFHFIRNCTNKKLKAGQDLWTRYFNFKEISTVLCK